MLPWSNATDNGVLPPLPGSSTGLVADPFYRGDPSTSRAIVVAINSTCPISSVPTP